MDISPTDLGVIAGIVIVVIVFVRYVAKRDESMTKVITNHLHDSTVVQVQMIESNNTLASAIDKFADKIDKKL